jgi:hypothetical protein
MGLVSGERVRGGGSEFYLSLIYVVGGKGFQVARNESPAVIVLNLHMSKLAPQLNGGPKCHHLKQCRRGTLLFRRATLQ